jgi:hypothetical protein
VASGANEGLKRDFESASVLELGCSQVLGSNRGSAITDTKYAQVRRRFDLDDAGLHTGPDTVETERLDLAAQLPLPHVLQLELFGHLTLAQQGL